MISFRPFALSILFFALLHSTFAQQKKNLSFLRIGIEQGLPQAFVRTIIQDSRGFMWFGTANDGLSKYDGYKFTVYRNDPKDKFSLCNNHINQIIEDSKGNIWVGTGNGLAKFDRNTEKFHAYYHNLEDSNSLSSNYVQTLVEDENGIIWVGTEVGNDKLGGLNAFDPKTNTFTHYFTGIDIRSVVLDYKKNLWVGSSGEGLFYFNKTNKSFINYRSDEKNASSIAHNSIHAVFEDSNHNLWIASRSGGLSKFDSKTSSFKQYKKDTISNQGLTTNAILSLTEDQEGNIWIGTENGGLTLLDPKTDEMSHYLHEINDVSALSGNSIHALYMDRDHNMWVAPLGGGLDLMNSESTRFRLYKPSTNNKGLNHYGVFSLNEDSEGNLLIGTDGGGLNILNKKTGEFSYMKNIPGNKNTPAGNHILSVMEDSRGDIWMGTWGNGASVYNKKTKTFKHFSSNPNDPTSLGSNNVWCIYEDSNQNVWLGTFWGGLCLYDRKTNTFRQFKKDNNNPGSIGSNDISDIIEDKQGNLWLGTYNGGLIMMDKTTFTFKTFLHSEEENSISSNIIFSIFEDENSDLWLGTISGLNHFNRQTGEFTSYNSKDGLFHDLIRAVTSDADGNLWISSNRSLSKMDIKTKTFKNYVGADGAKITEFTDAMHRSKSGMLYFGGNNGFVEFDPLKIRDTNIDPKIEFTDFLIFNKKVAIYDSINDTSPLKAHISEIDSITLSYKHSVITFEFAALYFTGEKNKQYAYRLEGFDEKWNEIGTKRTATYTNLNPGKYVLHVKALINGTNWSKHSATLYITITPPFWKTWWFTTLCVLFILGIVFVIYSIRVSSIKKQKKLLEEQVVTRTAELKNANDEIAILYNEIKDSIRAAQEVQAAILPPADEIGRHLKDFFAFYKPKDIVSGDFYWFHKKDDKIIIAAVDCTGHGVSGALMSVNGYYLLKLAISECENLIASEILNKLNEGVIRELMRNDSDMSGMDISLCVIDLAGKKLHFAGANSPLYIVRKGNLTEVKGDRYSIGQLLIKKMVRFNNHCLDLEENDRIFMSSDGIKDQFGGKDGTEKFSGSRLRELLIEISIQTHHPTELLDQSLKEWMRETEQLDDIMVLGFKI